MMSQRGMQATLCGTRRLLYCDAIECLDISPNAGLGTSVRLHGMHGSPGWQIIPILLSDRAVDGL